MWLVPESLLVFGFEAVLRSLKPATSAYARQKGTIPICILALTLMLFITWLSLIVVRLRGQCRPTLASWMAPSHSLAVPILCALLILSVVSASIVMPQFLRSRRGSSAKTETGHGQRLAAVQTLSYALILVIFSVGSI